MRLKTILLSGLGFVFLGIAAIGIFLPIWPTTPFVLLSAACVTSSPRIKARIMKIPFFNEHIQNYEQRCGLSRKTVRISMVWLWGMLCVSAVISKSFWVSVLLLIVGAAVTVHILCMAKAKAEKKEGPQ